MVLIHESMSSEGPLSNNSFKFTTAEKMSGYITDLLHDTTYNIYGIVFLTKNFPC